MSRWLEEAKKEYSYTLLQRRHLHENPELTSREFETVAYICKELENEDILYANILDGGVLAWLDGKQSGQHVLLRADCDALPILESKQNELYPKTCVSLKDGISHACGHDAHTAMLLTAAKILKRETDFAGRIYFLFERGEEGGNCIYYVMKEIQKRKIQIDACYGLHVDTALPVGTIGFRKGILNSGNVNFEITLAGKTGHGSRPDTANNPIDCFLAIGNALKDLRMKYVAPDSPLTYNIGSVHAGNKRNIVPESLTFLGTVRFHDWNSGMIFKEKMKKMIENISAAYGCRADFVEFTGPSFSVFNESSAVDIAKEAVENLVGKDHVVEVPVSLGSESFATLSAFYPSAFLRLGVRNEEKGITASVHQPQFDMDEEALIIGAALHCEVALVYLAQERKYPQEFKPFAGTADDFLQKTNRPVPKRYDNQESERL